MGGYNLCFLFLRVFKLNFVFSWLQGRSKMTEADKKHKGQDEFKKHPAKKIRPGRGKLGRMGGFSPSGRKHPGTGRAR